MPYHSYSRRPVKSSSGKRWLFLLIPVLIIAGLVWWLIAGGHKAEAPEGDGSNYQVEQTPEAEQYQAPDLQPVVEEWVQGQAASYGIVVYDPQAKRIIGFNQPEKVMFAASLYKIYIAYLMYKDFQAGAQNPDEILSQGRTKRACADAMIRSSDSPCGEAAMANMGQSVLNQRAMDEIGTTGTYFNGIRTNAQDAALVLQKILEGQDLNPENTAALLDSMLTQDARFKRGLQTGAPGATWHTKVGWNEDDNYHDIGIMTMPDGRKFVVAVLSDGQGSSAPIADFAKTIYAALAQ